jgi:hypothetical protein
MFVFKLGWVHVSVLNSAAHPAGVSKQPGASGPANGEKRSDFSFSSAKFSARYILCISRVAFKQIAIVGEGNRSCLGPADGLAAHPIAVIS